MAAEDYIDFGFMTDDYFEAMDGPDSSPPYYVEPYPLLLTRDGPRPTFLSDPVTKLASRPQNVFIPNRHLIKVTLQHNGIWHNTGKAMLFQFERDHSAWIPTSLCGDVTMTHVEVAKWFAERQHLMQYRS